MTDPMQIDINSRVIVVQDAVRFQRVLLHFRRRRVQSLDQTRICLGVEPSQVLALQWPVVQLQRGQSVVVGYRSVDW